MALLSVCKEQPHVAAAFESAGLTQDMHIQEPDADWPTLLEMVESGRRLAVMAEKDSGSAR